LLDATLVRMALADQFASIGDLVAQASGNGSNPSPAAQKKKFVEVVERELRQTVAEQPAPAEESPSSSTNDDDDNDDLPAVGKVWEGPRESLATLMAKSTARIAAPLQKPEPPNIEAVNPGDLPGQWQAMLTLISKHGPGLHGILSQGRFIGVDDGQAVIRVSKSHETFIARLQQKDKADVIRDVVSKVLNESVGVRFEVEETTTATVAPPAPTRAPAPEPPAPRAAATGAPTLVMEASTLTRLTDEMRHKLYNDEPLIRAVVDQLGGTILKLEE
jgi:hypothetical protein